MIALLERFYDPIKGQILVDGVDIKDLQLRWLRTQIGLVSQEPALFATSIRENILLGKDNATIEEVIEAAKRSNAHTFVEQFPDGYETQVHFFCTLPFLDQSSVLFRNDRSREFVRKKTLLSRETLLA